MPDFTDPSTQNPEAPATIAPPTPSITDPAAPTANDAPIGADPTTPPDAPSAPKDKNAWPGIAHFVEENRHHLPPAPDPTSPAPPSMHDGPRPGWAAPDHLSLPHPGGGYMASRLISRATDDLAALTQGKRAGTPAEAREAFGQALLAEDVAPRGYSAEDAVRWWQAGGVAALRQQPKPAMMPVNYIKADDSGSLLDPPNPPEDGIEDEAPETPTRSAAPPPAPVGNIDRHRQPGARQAATTLPDVLKDIDDNWDRAKPHLPTAPNNPDAAVTKNKAPVTTKIPKISGYKDPRSIPADGQGAKFSRSWPVPIPASGVHFPIKGEKDVKGRIYSDGRYAPAGGFRGKGRGHHGDDLPSPLDTPVRASADGAVVMTSTEWAKILARDPKTKKPLMRKDKKGNLSTYMVRGNGPEMDGWGHFLEVLHPDGYITLYAHLREVPKIKIGTPVRLGQQIGVLGSTGNAKGRGSHVHLEVRDTSGHTYNPVDWMNGRLPPRKR